LDLTVESGAVAGIVGPNGSGKTTLLRVIATLLKPAGGTGRVLGAPLGTDRIYGIRPHIELLGHEPSLYPDLTLRENLIFPARLSGRALERVDWALSAVGLSRVANRRAGHASWGMQRRVEFARIFLREPKLLLLDEPHSGLDADASALVAAAVEQVRARRGSAILASHRQDQLSELVDELFELGGGALSVLREAPV
jgi:ABC-type multidrug transport system ATPase subunit